MYYTCISQAQDDKTIKGILNKLEEVKEGEVLDVTKAYVIDANEQVIKYKTFKGKWLLIDFWSTGCAPCIKEFPALAKFSKEFNDSINIIAVSVDSKFERYKKSAKKYKINVPHYFGGYTYGNQLFNLNIKIFKTEEGDYVFKTMTPQYVLIDPKGKIVNKNFPKPSSVNFKASLLKALGII